jgi:hypothetical protein
MRKILLIPLVFLLYVPPMWATQNSKDYFKITKIKEKSNWFGKIESSRAYINDNKETVIEWYCHKYEILANVNFSEIGKSVKTIKVAEKDIIHFVVTIRSPSMPIEKAKQTATETTNKTHYVAWKNAEIAFEGIYLDKKAFYLKGGGGRITDKIKVIHVK